MPVTTRRFEYGTPLRHVDERNVDTNECTTIPSGRALRHGEVAVVSPPHCRGVGSGGGMPNRLSQAL